MKILLICSESYSTSGSPLALAVSSIVSAYREQGACTLGFCPFFAKQEDRDKYTECGKHTEELRSMEYSVLRRTEDEFKDNLFVDFEDYFGRDGIYGDKYEKSYMDNHLRFSFLASAAISYCIKLGFIPDAVHVHEWSGIAGALTKTIYKKHFENIPITLTIHDVRYDFQCTPRHIQKIGLPEEDFNSDGYEFWGRVSMLKAAILYSDSVVFTSPSYLFYILSTDLPGGLRDFLESHRHKLLGIQNGVNYNVWKVPEDVEAFKRQKKDEFRAELGLEANSSILIYAHFNLDFDDSAQIISTIMADLLSMNLQLAIGISQDDSNYPYFAAVQAKNSSKMVLLPLLEGDESLCHRLIASDAFFSISMDDPSVSFFFKSMAVGTIPISSRRFKHPFALIKLFSEQSAENEDKAHAFVSDEVSPDLVLKQIRLVESTFCESKSLWSKIVKNAISLKVPWSRTAEEYFSTFVSSSSKGL